MYQSVFSYLNNCDHRLRLSRQSGTGYRRVLEYMKKTVEIMYWIRYPISIKL
uniref:Uncharacterized protein n=1 Tax=Helianthus annuus TaxID=4232 RepID=A0A251UH39_HELAN